MKLKNQKLQIAIRDWNKAVDEEHRLYIAANYEGVCIAHPLAFRKNHYYEYFSKFMQVFDKVFVVTDREDEFIQTLKNAITLINIKDSVNVACKNNTYKLDESLEPVKCEWYEVHFEDNNKTSK